MNILTTRYDCARWLADDRSDMCEHVEKDHKLAEAVLCEDDSFGPVDRNIVCKPCHEMFKQEEAARIVGCFDCKSRKLKSEILEWRWYDFYAAQGDEPLVICDECWGLPKHKERMRKDREEAAAEDEYLSRKNSSY